MAVGAGGGVLRSSTGNMVVGSRRPSWPPNRFIRRGVGQVVVDSKYVVRYAGDVDDGRGG